MSPFSQKVEDVKDAITSLKEDAPSMAELESALREIAEHAENVMVYECSGGEQ